MTTQIPRRVLIIEDDRDYRALLERFLNNAFPDATVEQYDPLANGRPGADFDWARFDVLILDYRLGENENGLDWLREYKKKGRKFPATILLTAAGSEEVAVRALRFGAHDYLKKQNLDEKQLSASIADAFKMRAEEENAHNSITINASRFSITYFYGQFALACGEVETGKTRAVILIKIGGYEALQHSLGVLGTDEIARFLVKVGFEQFRFSKYPPRATRYTDSLIAFLVGGYKSRDDLERSVRALGERINTSPPFVNNSPIPITVSVGAVTIASPNAGVHGLLKQAQRTVSAARTEGNSFAVVNSERRARPKSGSRERDDVFDAKAAMQENRIQVLFRPISAVSEASSVLGFDQLLEVSPCFISLTGERIAVDPVLAKHADKDLTRLVDRWKIRECVRQLLGKKVAPRQLPKFLVGVSEASCGDVKLASWIAELMRFYGAKKGFGEFVLALSPGTVVRNVKPVVALLEHLKTQHGFRFALDSVEDPALCKCCVTNFPFDIIILTQELVHKLATNSPRDDALKNLVNVKANALMLARGIEDANGLHAVITAGIDLVQGDFIAPEQEEFAIVSGIESVQLGE